MKPSLVWADLKLLDSLDILRDSLRTLQSQGAGSQSGSRRTGNASATCSSGGRANTSSAHSSPRPCADLLDNRDGPFADERDGHCRAGGLRERAGTEGRSSRRRSALG